MIRINTHQLAAAAVTMRSMQTEQAAEIARLKKELAAARAQVTALNEEAIRRAGREARVQAILRQPPRVIITSRWTIVLNPESKGHEA